VRIALQDLIDLESVQARHIEIEYEGIGPRFATQGAGFAAHLDKPVDQQALIRAIEMATLPH
jgi:hypothetical protein